MNQGFDFITNPHSLQDFSFLMFPPDCDDLEDTLGDCSGSLSFRDIEYYLQASPSPLCAGNNEEGGKDEDLKHSDLPIKAIWSGEDAEITQQPHGEASRNSQQKISLSYSHVAADSEHPIKNKRGIGKPVRDMRNFSKSIVQPAKAVGKAVSQASSAVTAKFRSIGSLFHGLRFPCLSKAECKA